MSERGWREQAPGREPLGRWLVHNVPRGANLAIPRARESRREIPFASGPTPGDAPPTSGYLERPTHLKPPMPIDPTAFWKRVHLGEDTGVELKEVRFRGRKVAAPKRSDLADGFAAFANSGGGWFVLGVRDDRTHQALTPGPLDSVAQMVTEICAANIQPPLDFSLQRMPAPESGDGGVLLVDIPRGA